MVSEEEALGWLPAWADDELHPSIFIQSHLTNKSIHTLSTIATPHLQRIPLVACNISLLNCRITYESPIVKFSISWACAPPELKQAEYIRRRRFFGNGDLPALYGPHRTHRTNYRYDIYSGGPTKRWPNQGGETRRAYTVHYAKEPRKLVSGWERDNRQLMRVWRRDPNLLSILKLYEPKSGDYKDGPIVACNPNHALKVAARAD